MTQDRIPLDAGSSRPAMEDELDQDKAKRWPPLVREIDADAFRAADRIALKHTVKGAFESIANSVARKIRIRTDIYNALMAQRTRQEERVRVLEEALRPFNIIAGELFARNFNRKDKVYSIQGISPDGFPVELSLLFEAFLNAHAALGNGGGDAR